MEKDKVESRTSMNDCPKCGGTHFGERKGNCPLSADYVADKPWPKPVPDEVIYSSVPDVPRPSVPQQGQALSRLLAIAADVARRKYLPDIEDCRTIDAARQMASSFSDDHSKLANDLKEVWDALAASRSEEATVRFHDFLPCNQFVRLVREMFIAIHDGIELAEDKKREWLKLLNESAGAPAAGSTEREAIQKCAKAIEQDLNNHKKGPYREGLRDAMRIVTALAGTDTDVAKEKL